MFRHKVTISDLPLTCWLEAAPGTMEKALVLVAVSWGVRLSFWMWAASGVRPDVTEETVGAWRREMWAQTAILREPGCATAVTWLSASLNLTLGSNLWYTLIIVQENIGEDERRATCFSLLYSLACKWKLWCQKVAENVGRHFLRDKMISHFKMGVLNLLGRWSQGCNLVDLCEVLNFNRIKLQVHSMKSTVGVQTVYGANF